MISLSEYIMQKKGIKNLEEVTIDLLKEYHPEWDALQEEDGLKKYTTKKYGVKR